MLNLLKRQQHRVITEPKFITMLFNDARFSILWLVARVWLGYQWMDAGMHKISDPAWMETGAALQSYWARAVAIPEAGRPAITFDWYRDFLQSLLDAGSYTWFAKVIAVGEVMVGIALILGTFVGVVALLGAIMNFNFMLSASASTNPVLFLIAIGLVMAWKISGFIGADYYLLNLIGTPWNRGKFKEDDPPLEPLRQKA